MKRILIRCIVLLTCTLLAAGEAGAADRGSGARESTSTKAATSASGKSDEWRRDLAAWLGRLEGSFEIKLKNEEETRCSAAGVDRTSGVQVCTTEKAHTYVSSGNCRSIGEGPGLYCTFEEFRHETPGHGAGSAGAVAPMLFNALPGRMLFGIDPVARPISAMIMDPNGSGYAETGTLVGDDVTVKGRCVVNTAYVSGACTWSLWIHAPPDGRRILITRTRRMGTDSRLEKPNTYELNRVEQPAQPRE